MSRLAVRDPVALGAKLTPTEHDPLGATVAPEHVSVPTGKSPGFAPDVATVSRWSSSAPVLVTVTVWGELVVPTRWLPKLRLLVLRMTWGGRASNAPMSHWPPWGRDTPRWSVAGQDAPIVGTPSMAALPEPRASVSVGP